MLTCNVWRVHGGYIGQVKRRAFKLFWYFPIAAGYRDYVLNSDRGWVTNDERAEPPGLIDMALLEQAMASMHYSFKAYRFHG